MVGEDGLEGMAGLLGSVWSLFAFGGDEVGRHDTDLGEMFGGAEGARVQDQSGVD